MRRLLDHLFGDRLSRALRSQLQSDPLQQAETALRTLPRHVKQLSRTLTQQQHLLQQQEERYLQAVRHYRQLVAQPEQEPDTLAHLEQILPRWKDDLEAAQGAVGHLQQSLQQAQSQLRTYQHDWQRLQQQAQRTAALQQEQQLRDQLQQTAQSLESATIAIASAQWQTAALSELSPQPDRLT
ncbi:MAG: hypothetical protein HC926_04640 [Synechococcaceae cyanobacterium SM2_3_60]|nr:hypothetical protein [Synechococcaceae cyanobacterium SM2_3_60]